MTKDEALELALEALEEVVKWYQARDKDDKPMSPHNQNPEIKQAIETITVIKEALAQPEQEPVAWSVDWGHNGDVSCASIVKKHKDGTIEVVAIEYDTKPTPTPQRTWVGLEKNDMPDGEDPMFDHKYFYVGMVFAAKVLKEKNT